MGGDSKQELKEEEEEKDFFNKVNKKWAIPVTIRPSIKKDKNFDFVKKFDEGGGIFKSANPPLPVNAPKPPSPEELNDFVNYKNK